MSHVKKKKITIALFLTSWQGQTRSTYSMAVHSVSGEWDIYKVCLLEINTNITAKNNRLSFLGARNATCLNGLRADALWNHVTITYHHHMIKLAYLNEGTDVVRFFYKERLKDRRRGKESWMLLSYFRSTSWFNCDVIRERSGGISRQQK